MKIRDATEADLPAILAIYNAAVATRMSTADTEPLSLEQRRPWFHSHTPGTRPLWVAETHGAVAAWLSLEDFHERAAYNRTAEVSIYVAESHRRRGLARELLQEALRRSESFGVETLIALVFGHNEPSLRLFEEMRFERWGTLPRVTVLDGVERDVVILGLRVG